MLVKRVLSGAMSLAIAASAFASPAAGVFAQSRTQTNAPGTWGSAILIQNVGTATLTADQYSIDFYTSAGTGPTTLTPPTGADIAAGASKEFYIPNSTAVTLDPGQYSAVVNSAQPVKAVVNSSTDHATAAPWSAFSYEGIDSADAKTKLYFPGFYKNYYGFQSELVIQNTGTIAATVQATFYNGHTGAVVGPIQLGSIAAYAAVTFSGNDALFPNTSLPSGTADSIWSVVVESTNGVNLAGVSNIWTESVSDAGVSSYNASGTGNQKLYAGAIYNQYYGFVSSLTLQNVSATEVANGTIRYSNGITQSFTIPSNRVKEVFVPNVPNIGTKDTDKLLAAEITATSGSLVGLVNIQRKAAGSLTTSDPSNPALGSYNTATAASTSVRVPAIYATYYGYFTAVTVQNTNLTQPADTILTYADGTTWKQTIPPGETRNFDHLPTTSGNPLALATNVQTGGTITATQPVVVVIQHNSDRALTTAKAKFFPNDFLFALSGFPQLP